MPGNDVFPRQVIDDTPAYAQPDWEPRRREMARRTVRVLEDEHSRAPFDAFVVPSDLFFYVRDRMTGKPFAVLVNIFDNGTLPDSGSYVLSQWTSSGPTSAIGWSISPSSAFTGNLSYQDLGSGAGEILVSGVTAKVLRDTFTFEPRGEHRVGASSRLVPVEASGGTPATGRSTSRPSPLVR